MALKFQVRRNWHRKEETRKPAGVAKQMTLTRNEAEVTTFRPLVTKDKFLKIQGHRGSRPGTQTKVTLTTMRSWTNQMERVALAAV